MRDQHQLRAEIISLAIELEGLASDLTFGRIAKGDGTARMATIADLLKGLACEVNELRPR